MFGGQFHRAPGFLWPIKGIAGSGHRGTPFATNNTNWDVDSAAIGSLSTKRIEASEPGII